MMDETEQRDSWGNPVGTEYRLTLCLPADVAQDALSALQRAIGRVNKPDRARLDKLASELRTSFAGAEPI